ncbi:uncharacterized protein V6R79_013367 [Siganus canaliculatus]
MKLAVSWFCMLPLAFVSAGLSSLSERQSATRNSLSDSRAAAPRSSGSSNQGRHRPLFARRGQYERQRIHVPRPKEVPVPAQDLTPPLSAAPKSETPDCSQLTQSCMPQSGCCDKKASCHCRFFNTICFCRKTGSSQKKKKKT